jgi:hypothetical protein
VHSDERLTIQMLMFVDDTNLYGYGGATRVYFLIFAGSALCIVFLSSVIFLLPSFSPFSLFFAHCLFYSFS